ncbi:hypothetical protein ASPBRDRAFT_436339 [Aspergillus brasiliensis CBS 101740]|uniref:Uncharacterized protein n=1 Tax=Aspergillus brasiliensis (strain CBS 101740 / IMI 381727 / IBT 21946) TaxID=767769 RepID=A0A1L9U2N1_ASPBC|nr:hypothetical protein ASPBRDRAFT_436339 [Aspergillus brasiliensis CBS 101740]
MVGRFPHDISGPVPAAIPSLDPHPSVQCSHSTLLVIELTFDAVPSLQAIELSKNEGLQVPPSQVLPIPLQVMTKTTHDSVDRSPGRHSALLHRHWHTRTHPKQDIQRSRACPAAPTDQVHAHNFHSTLVWMEGDPRSPSLPGIDRPIRLP